jgi:hypothetical protein
MAVKRIVEQCAQYANRLTAAPTAPHCDNAVTVAQRF